jgi:hypothetical protein
MFYTVDGYSNGGDPRPAAEKLKALGVEFYTFGIRNGNVKVGTSSLIVNQFIKYK